MSPANEERRSTHFSGGREPLQSHASLRLLDSKTSGPFNFLNPTQAYLRHVQPKSDGIPEGPTGPDGERDESVDEAQPREQSADGVLYKWSARNNRKGRHQIVAAPAKDSSGTYLVPQSTSSLRIILQTIVKMFIKYPWYDISWLVAYIFTWGSIIWVINAFFVFLPLVRPSTEFKNEILTGGGVTALIGATVFEVGSVFLMLEAINENREGCFGWAVEKVMKDKHRPGRSWRLSPDTDSCTHHHSNKHNLVGPSEGQTSDIEKASSPNGQRRAWSWYPSWKDLKGHYIHELGFLACLAQLIGATIFWISGFTALPGILNHLSPGLENGIYWTPQVLGGSGFVISGTLFMLETQKKWYLPAFGTLGWHIGFWNWIGGLGFTLCPAFGYDISSWAQYQASLSTFWGSFAFFIGSLIQLYESLQKHPVDMDKNVESDTTYVT